MSTSEETRKYITAYAFGVSDTLVGKALASPLRRLCSITLDLLVVLSLTLMSLKMLAACVCVVSIIGYFKARKQQAKNFAPTALIISAVVSALIFVSVHWFSGLQLDWEFGTGDKDKAAINTEESTEVLEMAKSEDKEASGIWHFFTGSADGDDAEAVAPEVVEAAEGKDTDGLSFVNMAQAALSDLGLGFGWAALYFSVFIAWFNGQTLGKMLFRIRVVKLDGENLTLWESFERYGGYSAGLATGLLGFLQVTWDANRQAIHDKISETMVIDLRKPDRVN